MQTKGVEGNTLVRLGTLHERPALFLLNQELAALGTAWRATTAKSIGLHLWNPDSRECRCVDESGWVRVPDL